MEINQEDTNPSEIRVYFDHSMLDILEKSGAAAEWRALLPDHWRVVYSYETLREILRSPDYKESFCRVLEDLGGAQIIIDPCPSEGRPEFTIRMADPREALDVIEYDSDREASSSAAEDGFWSFAAKAYGNLSDVSYSDVFGSIERGLNQSIETALYHARNSDLPLTPQMKEALAQLEHVQDAGLFQDVLSEAGQAIEADLPSTTDNKTGEYRQMSPLEWFQQATGLSPERLNNLRGKAGVVEEIQRLEAEALNIPIERGQFAQLLRGDNIRTRADKVNLLYNWLNFCGYRRDIDVRKKIGAYVGFWSDMTHVSIASYCHILITRDARQADKAKAVYEYLEIPTYVMDVNSQQS